MKISAILVAMISFCPAIALAQTGASITCTSAEDLGSNRFQTVTSALLTLGASDVDVVRANFGDATRVSCRVAKIRPNNLSVTASVICDLRDASGSFRGFVMTEPLASAPGKSVNFADQAGKNYRISCAR